MDLAELEVALAAYIDNEVIPAMEGATTFKKIGIAAAIAQAKSSGLIEKYFDQIASDPIFSALGVVTEDGKVGDVDTMCDSIKEALEQNGPVKIPFLEVKFEESDVDVLRGYLTGKSSPSDTRVRGFNAQTKQSRGRSNK